MKSPDSPKPLAPGAFESPAGLPEYAAMYEVSGNNAITEHTWERYQRCKANEDAKIAEHITQTIPSYKERILNARPEEIAGLISKALDQPDPETWKECAGFILEAPPEQRDALREKVFALILKSFSEKDAEKQKASSELIWLVPANEHPELQAKVLSIINNSFAGTSDAAKIACLPMLWCIDIDEKTDILTKGLSDKNPKVRQAAADMLWCAPSADITALIRQCLETDDPDIRRAAAETISQSPDDQQEELRHKVSDLVAEGLDSGDIEKQKFSLSLIHLLSPEQKEKYFRRAQKEFAELLIDSSLYKNSPLTANKFGRTAFEKTGSGTTLLGGTLMGKTILRHINPAAFITWQKLYENHELWKEAGFDYVPIEPIHAYHLNPEGRIDVAGGVLDINFSSWQQLTNDFDEELEGEMEAIKIVLEKENIEHGHPHRQNFCLRFFRNADGKPDFSQKPRLYLIDFDQAVSPG